MTKRTKNIIIIVSCVLVFTGTVLGVTLGILLNTQRSYYLNKDTGMVITSLLPKKSIDTESSLQTYIRRYLAGSPDYRIKLPFALDVELINANHDDGKNILILNWNTAFYKFLESDTAEREINLLLSSIKRNARVKEVYFLVNGESVEFTGDSYDLSGVINMKDVVLKKK